MKVTNNLEYERQPRCSKPGNAVFDPRIKPSFMTKRIKLIIV